MSKINDPYQYVRHHKQQNQEVAVLFKCDRSLKMMLTRVSQNLNMTNSEFIRSAIEFFADSLEARSKERREGKK